MMPFPLSPSMLFSQVLVEDEWLALQDALELEVLERCDGSGSSAAALAAEIADESEGAVAEAEVIDRLRLLYARRLISME